MKTKQGFNVYRNDQFVTFLVGTGMNVCKDYARHAVIHTHMGEWRALYVTNPRGECFKPRKEFEYSTTTGVYLKFVPAFR
jgi:hypothetical protein